MLPYLLKGGEKAAEEVGKKFGSTVWDRATVLWARLRPRLEAKPAAQKAIQEVARWLEEAQRAGVRITVASGDRSVAVGGTVTGSTIIIGDGNQ
ncbi:MAG: hypothetical protein WAK96_00715 [Desulfobaccales bacterium]